MEFLEGKYIVIVRNNPFEEVNLGNFFGDWYDSLEEAIAHQEDEDISIFPARYEETLVLKIEKVIVNIEDTRAEPKTYHLEDAKRKIQELENINWRDLTLNEVKYIAALKAYVDGRREEYPRRTLGIG